jgi:hypothetical protein
METVQQETTEAKKLTEKEQLELLEKRVEIQKKRLEIKKEKMSIRKIILDKEREHLDLTDKKISIKTKQLENKKTKLDMEELLAQREIDTGRLLNDNIFSVLLSLIVNTIDDERTVLGSEPFYVPLLNGKNRDVALNKLLDLINKL